MRLGARMAPFAGYMMPIQYRGIIEEHRAVRTGVGLFDLSHMGEFVISGPGALETVDRLVTNDILGLEPWQVRYSPMCSPSGGIVDDILVYRFPDHLVLVVNASNIDKDLAWVEAHASPDVTVENASDATALIAVQGPLAEQTLQPLTDTSLSDIGYYHFTVGTVGGANAIISRTGYTGEDGFELYTAPANAVGLWQQLLEQGGPVGIQPIGLGARDTLRLESGYMLYGNDIGDDTSPLEAGLGWTVKLGQRDFLGSDVLEEQKRAGVQRRMIALETRGRAIPRPHTPILRDGEIIGEVTSGTFSPTFERGIGLGYIRTGSAARGDAVDLDIRGRMHPAELVRKPIYRREGGSS